MAMVFFLLTILLFFLLFALFSLSLGIILKKRGEAEEAEYLLSKAYIKRYNFILGISIHLNKEDADTLLSLREKAIKVEDIKSLKAINDNISKQIDSLELQEDDRNEAVELKMDIDECVKEYNIAVDIFNRKVFGILNRFAAKVCKVCRMERL